MCKSHLQVKQLDSGSKSSFKYLVCRISWKSVAVTIVAIYHPPYSVTNNNTNEKFIDEFTEYLAESIMMYNNIVILGDFNLHINNQEDPDTGIFIDTITALGLDQHVAFATHNKGNILDLVMAEPLGKINVTSCTPGPFPLDHCAVKFTISVNKQHMERKEITFCHTKDIDYEIFTKDLHMDDIKGSELDSMVESFNNSLQTTLDFHAPAISRIIITKPKNPWFTPKLKLQKQTVRCMEKA